MPIVQRPSEKEAMAAVRPLIAWAGDDPDREGLIETPKRVAKAYREFFAGYDADLQKILGKTFEEVAGFEDMVLMKNMRFESHCEHHIAPIIGVCHIAYIPNKKVVGLSKMAHLLDAFAKRLQTQETMTSQIAKAIEEYLDTKGVAVLIDAEHQCMTTRGAHKEGTTTITKTMLGNFRTDKDLEQKFLLLVK